MNPRSHYSAKYYLLEEYSGSIDLEGANVVALSPQSAFSLDMKGLPYTIPDDYYDESRLRAEEDKYLLGQLEWIDGLDTIIRDGLDFCRAHNVSLIRRIFYLPFKYIADHTIIETYIMRKFIEKANPKEIVYIYNSNRRKNPKNLYRWIDKGANFYMEILSLLASEYGFSIAAVDLAGSVAPEVSTIISGENIFKRTYLAVRRIVKTIYLVIKHNKGQLLFRPKKDYDKRLSILFLHSGCQPMDFLIKNFLQKGADIFVKENSDIFDENFFFRKRALSLDKTDKDKGLFDDISSKVEAIMPMLYEKGRLLGWISNQCSMDISPILKPAIEYFFKDMVVNTIIESMKIIDFCKKNKVHFIAARAGTDSDPVSGLLASNCVKEVKSVCFQHGCYALDFKMMHMTEAGMFDIYFASDDLSEKYFKEESPSYIKNRCLVFQEPYKFLKIRSPKTEKNKNIINKVLYIPANHSFYLRYFNNLDYSATWYYKFQKEILDFLASKKDTIFIYKHSGHEWCYQSIISYIAKKGYNNIVVENGKIPEYLSGVEKVIIDCPSTPLFEAAAFGMPVLAIFRDYMPVWQPCVDYFGRRLQPFDGTTDAIKKIDTFLKSNPEEYYINLPVSTGNTYEALMRLRDMNK